jgi:very-short-patch-repair endonuclease
MAVALAAKPLMTVREQPMYWRLQEAFPGEVVLAQVAFSALLTASDRAIRNTFDRRVADFVVCTKGLRVTAVVELDDSSHKGREAEDAEREGLLERAGYTVLRFKHMPSAADLQSAIGRTTPALQSAVAE